MSYQSPGVYMREVSSGSKPISNASTSTGAFIGIAEKGPTDKAIFIANWTQFIKTFGNFIPGGQLAYAVYSFFQEGGGSCFVVRVDAENSTIAADEIPASKTDGEGGEEKASVNISANSKGDWGNRITVSISDPLSASPKTHFNMTVLYEEAKDFTNEYDGKDPREVKEEYVDVSMESLLNQVNPEEDGEGGSAFIRIKSALNLRPDNGEYTLKNGVEGDLNNPKIFIAALNKFDPIDEILTFAIPDSAGNRAIILNTIAYCQKRQDCFFIVDPPRNLGTMEVIDFKNGTGQFAGESGLNSSYAGLYYPWVYISDPATGRKKLVPPSAHIAGIYAYTDNRRGIYKAPAGIGVGNLKTIVGLERLVSKQDQDMLHPRSVNALRSFAGAGSCVWGSNTLSADPEWKYINIRRLFIMVRVSIERATQWVVFEPNNRLLWSKVNRNVSAYLSNVWQSGALVGETADQAFYVKVDAENNPQSTIDVGELHIDIGIAPVKPAEFVIFTISQKLQTAAG